MINNKQLELFIYRPLWQQHIVFVVLSLFIFVAGYYWIILPLINTTEAQYILISEEEQKINQLTERISLYSDTASLSQQYSQLVQQLVPKMTEKHLEVLLTEQIQSSNMLLHVFQQQHQDHHFVWHIELQGSYQQFVTFIQSSIEQQVPWGIESLVIDKIPSALLFSFKVSYNSDNRGSD